MNINQESKLDSEADIRQPTTYNQVIEKSNEYKEPLYIAFVDYEKAFDSVEHEDILNALEKHQIPTVYIETLASMYRNGTAQVKVDNNMSKPFKAEFVKATHYHPTCSIQVWSKCSED